MLMETFGALSSTSDFVKLWKSTSGSKKLTKTSSRFYYHMIKLHVPSRIFIGDVYDRHASTIFVFRKTFNLIFHACTILFLVGDEKFINRFVFISPKGRAVIQRNSSSFFLNHFYRAFMVQVPILHFVRACSWQWRSKFWHWLGDDDGRHFVH